MQEAFPGRRGKKAGPSVASRESRRGRAVLCRVVFYVVLHDGGASGRAFGRWRDARRDPWTKATARQEAGWTGDACTELPICEVIAASLSFFFLLFFFFLFPFLLFSFHSCRALVSRRVESRKETRQALGLCRFNPTLLSWSLSIHPG